MPLKLLRCLLLGALLVTAQLSCVRPGTTNPSPAPTASPTEQALIDQILKHYEEALRIFPDYAEAHNNLGNLLMNQNKLEEAIDQFREAIKNMPENASFHNNLGTAFGRQGKVAEAMGEFEEAIKHDPTYVEARVNLANAFLAAGRVEEAIAQLNEALRLKPDFKPALQAMQRARQQLDSSRAQK